MSKKKPSFQRRWVVGKEYWITNKSGGKKRRVTFVGRGKFEGRETLFVQPVRKARKQRHKKASKVRRRRSR